MIQRRSLTMREKGESERGRKSKRYFTFLYIELDLRVRSSAGVQGRFAVRRELECVLRLDGYGVECGLYDAEDFRAIGAECRVVIWTSRRGGG